MPHSQQRHAHKSNTHKIRRNLKTKYNDSKKEKENNDQYFVCIPRLTLPKDFRVCGLYYTTGVGHNNRSAAAGRGQHGSCCLCSSRRPEEVYQCQGVDQLSLLQRGLAPSTSLCLEKWQWGQ